MGSPDLVYMVRRGPNEELRYSLRTIAKNFKHGKVWMFGDPPAWVNPETVEIVRLPQEGNKWDNADRNRHEFLQHPVSDPFILMNDDFFCMEPVEELESYRLCRMEHRIWEYNQKKVFNSKYVNGMHLVTQRFQDEGLAVPICYEVHAPMLITHAGWQRALDTLDRWAERGGRTHRLLSTQFRSIYGNQEKVEAREIEDPKMMLKGDPFPDCPWWSTADVVFNEDIGRFLHYLYPEPCVYERTTEDESRKQAQG